MHRKFFLLLFCSLFFSCYSFCQDKLNLLERSDSCLMSLYNYDFINAHKHLIYLKKHFPDLAETYLIETNYYWWKIISGENEVENFNACNIALDKALSQIEKRTGRNISNENLFSLITIYAFKARLEIINENHVQVIHYLYKVINNLSASFEKEQAYFPFNLTSGLYNYFIEYAKQEYPLIAPFTAAFPEGNIKKGIEQLEKVQKCSLVINNEATYFLMKIYTEAHPDFEKAMYQTKTLTDKFQNNILFQYYHLKTCLINKDENAIDNQLKKIKSVAQSNNTISEKQKKYYIAKAYYKLGKYFQDSTDNINKALLCYSQVADYTVTKDEIYYSALLEKAKLLHQSNKSEAIAMYNEILNDSTDTKTKEIARKNLRLLAKD